MRSPAKPFNFSQPASLPSSHATEMVWLLCYMIAESRARRGYADERENPEWVDHGGEGK